MEITLKYRLNLLSWITALKAKTAQGSKRQDRAPRPCLEDEYDENDYSIKECLERLGAGGIF